MDSQVKPAKSSEARTPAPGVVRCVLRPGKMPDPDRKKPCHEVRRNELQVTAAGLFLPKPAFLKRNHRRGQVNPLMLPRLNGKVTASRWQRDCPRSPRLNSPILRGRAICWSIYRICSTVFLPLQSAGDS